MLSKKEAALPLEQQEPRVESPLERETPQAKDHTSSIAQPKPKVNKVDSLVSLRLAKGLLVRDMVQVVQTIYPKYDKIIQSKCEHGAEYGIQIRDDAFRALLHKFAPDIIERRAHDRKRNANRIQARLTESTMRRLKEALAEDGLTVQSWIEAQVYAYLERRCKKDA